MWLPGGESVKELEKAGDPKDGKIATVEDGDDKVTIAWRYKKLKQFQTTVSSSASKEYCQTLDLTSKIPPNAITNALSNGQLLTLDVGDGGQRCDLDPVLGQINDMIHEGGYVNEAVPSTTQRRALRLSIPDFGGPGWSDLSSTEMLRFLFGLRGILRGTNAAAFISLPSHLSRPSPTFSTGALASNEHWVEKLSFLSDGCISLTGFGADPSLASLFQNYHGMLHIYSSPSPHTLLPPSHKLSVLRGLASSSNQVGGGGENNLAFRCTRKRFIVETLHLDVEGGVGERRTTAPPGGAGVEPTSHTPSRPPTEPTAPAEASTEQLKPTKPKKRVIIKADAPEFQF